MKNSKEINVGAELSLLPESSTANAVRSLKYQGELPESFSTLDLLELALKQARQIKKGDVDLIIRHLYSQALALNALFETSLVGAAHAENPQAFEAYSRVSLKAQNQSRMAFENMVKVLCPPDQTIIQQQNNAVNQQVNNQIQSENLANELLSEETDNATVDLRGATGTIKKDSIMEAVGAQQRPQDSSRKRSK